jgi:hypothetical protein
MQIREIWPYPVKSMGGERLTYSHLAKGGIAHDRGWAVRDESDKTISGAKHFGDLMSCSACYLGDTPADPIPKAEITNEKLDILRKANVVYLDEIRKAGLYDKIWQAFAVLLPVRTVGVMGDGRTYDYVCALRAVTSTDGMTADSYPFEHAFLSRVATRIINEVKGINRVVYDVTSKPPGTIEWE